MYSWYTFSSTFVAGLSLIALFIIYLKNQGHLPYTNTEHLHDIGKFMFAFSIFWTYLWFSQFMLIWYANIPEETKYFRPRMIGEFRGLFWLNLILNFVTPFLILMKAGAKRNYAIMTFAAVIIIFGHWLDFYLMVMPGPLGDHATISWYELGIAAGYVGLIIWLVGRALEKAPLVPMNHPFLKESIIHHV
jgi:Ni/Fe-hydrogenase subunit HybB-like protein